MPFTVRRVQQVLHAAGHLEYTRMRAATKLTPWHRSKRMDWAKIQLRLSPALWKRTIFSDEKRFCLDGPDGAAYYWADKRLDKRYFSRRQQGGKSVMVWGCFSWKGKPELVFVPNTMNAQRYVRLLEDHLEPFGDGKHPNWFRLQQDNAKSHTAKITDQYFMEAGVSVLSWPSRSPDLNPIENLWAQVVRDVYSNFRHFDCEDDLSRR